MTTGTDARLSRQLRGDLDGIVLKALEKRPVDRYRTPKRSKTLKTICAIDP